MPSIRKMDELGRVVLPANLRNAIGAKKDDSFLITQSGKHTLKLTLKTQKSCMFCSSEEDLAKTNHGYLCKSCFFDLITHIKIEPNNTQGHGETP